MNIKETREIKGLTQQDVSDILAIPKRTIEAWESGARKAPEYVERLINEKLLSLTRKQIENEKKYIVVEFEKGCEEKVIYTGSRTECNSYEDFKRKGLKNEDLLLKDYATCKLTTYEQDQERAHQLMAYASTLSQSEKKAVVKIGDKEYAKFIMDFNKKYYNPEKEIKILKNSFDKSINFTDLNKAKNYYLSSDEQLAELLDPDNYCGSDFESYKKKVLEREKEIKEAESLEELADILTRTSDWADNGSQWYVE